MSSGEHSFIEQPVEWRKLCRYDESRVLWESESDAKKEAREVLDALLLKLLKEVATPRQWRIFQMMMMGKTQMEVAEKLGINQGTVCKALLGAPYRNRVKHGGLQKKARALLSRPDVRAAQQVLWEL